MCVLAVMYLGQIVEMAEAMELCDKPLHPYTQALFTAALPAHPDEPRQKLRITGEVVSTLARPRVAASTRAADGDGESAAEPPVKTEAAPAIGLLVIFIDRAARLRNRRKPSQALGLPKTNVSRRRPCSSRRRPRAISARSSCPRRLRS
jgi:oligopeptide/dipeptide ABC transporter ATP-binding protein